MILCAGEILADMIGEEKRGSFFFERKPGGAPFNVACAVKKLGGAAGFVGSVGDDITGDFLTEFAVSRNFDALDINRDKDKNTTLAFVEIAENGERSFCFHRKHTADPYLPPISDNTLNKADIVHIGSLMLSSESGLACFVDLVRRAKSLGKKISFDVNFRSDVFNGEKSAITAYKQVLPLCDVIKFSEDETEIFGRKYIDEELSGALRCISKGAKGSEILYEDSQALIPSFKVSPIDTTGAGDAFFGGVLFGLDRLGRKPTLSDLQDIFEFANACGALNTLKRGAIDGLPSYNTVKNFIKRGKNE